MNLFKGYKTIKDRPFLDYLQTIENGHEDGSAVVDAPHLMLHAVNFYKNRLTHKQWEQKSQQEWDVLALEAKVEQLQKNVQCLQNRYKFKLLSQWAKDHVKVKVQRKNKNQSNQISWQIIHHRNQKQSNNIMNGMGQNGIGVVKRTEVNVAVHGMHTYPHSAKGSVSVARVRSCPQRRIQQG